MQPSAIVEGGAFPDNRLIILSQSINHSQHEQDAFSWERQTAFAFVKRTRQWAGLRERPIKAVSHGWERVNGRHHGAHKRAHGTPSSLVSWRFSCRLDRPVFNTRIRDIYLNLHAVSCAPNVMLIHAIYCNFCNIINKRNNRGDRRRAILALSFNLSRKLVKFSFL